MKACLGIDTSCYTTSVALGAMDGASVHFSQARKLLAVDMGEQGLMQSAAVFQHVRQLPALLEALLDAKRPAEICAVCASDRPRPLETSYMPVFAVGKGYAQAIAGALGAPLFLTSHQQGHLRAAMVDTSLCREAPYLALHISGGTTEILLADGDALTLLGGSKDLHAGQLIDRIGVAMGLPFPAGPHLEKLAADGEAKSRLATAARGMSCHLSGAEAQAKRWLTEASLSHQDIAAEVFSCIARTTARMIVSAAEETGAEAVLLSGGVVTSALIRTQITRIVAKRRRGVCLHYARPDLSGDNAVGVALIGMEREIKQSKEETSCLQSS